MRARRLLAFLALAASASSPGASAAQSASSFPTTGVLVFSNELSDAGTLFTIAPDGSGLRSLGELEGYEPRWSPGGGLIAFSDGRIRLVRVDGTGVRALTRPRYGATDSSPAWSPRGKASSTRATPDPALGREQFASTAPQDGGSRGRPQASVHRTGLRTGS